MVGLFEVFFMAGFGMICLLGTVFWIWMLIDCAKNEPEGEDRVIWILIIALTHLIGAAIYYFARRRDRMREAGG